MRVGSRDCVRVWAAESGTMERVLKSPYSQTRLPSDALELDSLSLSLSLSRYCTRIIGSLVEKRFSRWYVVDSRKSPIDSTDSAF